MAAVAVMLAAAVASAQDAASPTELISRLRPRVDAYSTVEIDRVAAASGLTDCFWVATVSAQTFNILMPDDGTTAWVTQIRLPPGARLALEGHFAHARWVSLTSYDADGDVVDHLNDQQIAAAAGSTNPFLPGAARAAEARDWRIEVGPRVPAAARPDNTLRVPGDGAPVLLWYRVGLPDQDRDTKGGVPLPQPVLTLADGRVQRGDALCRAIVSKEGAVRDVHMPVDALKAVVALPSLSHAPPAPRVPEWNAFFNPPLVVTNLLTDTPYSTLRDRIDPGRHDAPFGTPDSTRMSMIVDARLGELLVLQGRVPRTPRTRSGNPVMQAGELRAWSLCQYRSLADTGVDACLGDEQVVQDGEGRVTIVISRPGTRPPSARAECGVTWLAWGKGDGIGNADGGFVALHQMLPSAAFRPHSLFAVRKPGDERDVLGPFYLQARYETRAAFERRVGCRP